MNKQGAITEILELEAEGRLHEYPVDRFDELVKEDDEFGVNQLIVSVNHGTIIISETRHGKTTHKAIYKWIHRRLKNSVITSQMLKSHQIEKFLDVMANLIKSETNTNSTPKADEGITVGIGVDSDIRSGYVGRYHSTHPTPIKVGNDRWLLFGKYNMDYVQITEDSFWTIVYSDGRGVLVEPHYARAFLDSIGLTEDVEPRIGNQETWHNPVLYDEHIANLKEKIEEELYPSGKYNFPDEPMGAPNDEPSTANWDDEIVSGVFDSHFDPIGYLTSDMEFHRQTGETRDGKPYFENDHITQWLYYESEKGKRAMGLSKESK